MSNGFQKEIDTPEIDTIANLAEHMVYRLPGCTDIMIRKELQRAYYDFSRLSCVFTSWDIIPLREGKLTYHMNAKNPRMQIASVRSVFLDNRKLERGEYSTSFDTITINPQVILDGYKSLRVCLQEVPHWGEEDAPRWFIEKYGQAIVAGALVRLFGMEGKPWANVSQLQAEMVTYENYLTETRHNSFGMGTNNGHFDVVDTSDLL